MDQALLEILEIDCAADPYIPDPTWKVLRHDRYAPLRWDVGGSQLRLLLTDMQRNVQQKWNADTPSTKVRKLLGDRILRDLSGNSFANANILDALLQNQHLIPTYWETGLDGCARHIAFPGTEFSISGRGRYVRSLCREGDVWRDDHTNLDKEGDWNYFEQCAAHLRPHPRIDSD